MNNLKESELQFIDGGIIPLIPLAYALWAATGVAGVAYLVSKS